MPTGMTMLSAVRLTRMIQALQDVRGLPQNLLFLGRTAVVNATDGEITARYNIRAHIADLVADDAVAGTYTSGKMTFEANQVPNLKIGAALTQEQLAQLLAIQQMGGVQATEGLYGDFENRIIDNLLLGVQERMEALCIAMRLDSFSYNRLGMQIATSWGMPADLNIVPSTAWTDATNATPVSDILGLKRYAQVRYGITYDRLTMSLSAFLLLIATTEFQTKARMFLAPNVSYINLPTQNTSYMRGLAASILEVAVVELYDARAWQQDLSGVYQQSPLLPINKVLFETIANDNDPRVQDFGNSITIESVVASMVGGGMIGNLGGPRRGPIAYATPPNTSLNPPQLTYWSVARGFPRKYQLQANAVLTIGTVVDAIPFTDPFA